MRLDGALLNKIQRMRCGALNAVSYTHLDCYAGGDAWLYPHFYSADGGAVPFDWWHPLYLSLIHI